MRRPRWFQGERTLGRVVDRLSAENARLLRLRDMDHGMLQHDLLLIACLVKLLGGEAFIPESLLLEIDLGDRLVLVPPSLTGGGYRLRVEERRGKV